MQIAGLATNVEPVAEVVVKAPTSQLKQKVDPMKKLAPDMPSYVAVKIQGRSLASAGEFGHQKAPERYMY